MMVFFRQILERTLERKRAAQRPPINHAGTSLSCKRVFLGGGGLGLGGDCSQGHFKPLKIEKFYRGNSLRPTQDKLAISIKLNEQYHGQRILRTELVLIQASD